MFTVGYATHPGLIRKDNEDAVYDFASPDRAIAFAVVADGMGAGDSGRKAAQFSIKILKYAFHELILDELISDRPVNVERRLTEAIKAANKKIMDTLPNGACSETTTAVVEDQVYVAHVGDSRAYLVEQTVAVKITEDHDLIRELVEREEIPSREEFINDGNRVNHVLFRALGDRKPFEVDNYQQPLARQSKILLCTDGLWMSISENDIADIVRQNRVPQQACDQFIAAANERGGQDNIALALIQAVG